MIENILAILLIAVVPARALYKSVWRNHDEANRPKTYIQSAAIIVGLVVLLSYAWVHSARTATSLGLDVPLSERGMVGLAIAVLLIVVVAGVKIFMKPPHQASDDNQVKKQPAANDTLPRTRHELNLFLGFAVLAGCGWELLYRGFLIWFLVPLAGTIGAVCIAAIAYGTAHGYKSRTHFVASIISAFVFTIAFVLTGSLWWLMLIHTAIGISGGISSYKRATTGGANI